MSPEFERQLAEAPHMTVVFILRGRAMASHVAR